MPWRFENIGDMWLIEDCRDCDDAGVDGGDDGRGGNGKVNFSAPGGICIVTAKRKVRRETDM